MAGIVAIIIAQSLLPVGINDQWPAYVLALIACIGTIYLIHLNLSGAALHFFLWVGWVSISTLAYLEGDPDHFIVQSASISACVLIALVGRPWQAILTGGLAILTNLLLTYLFSNQVIPTTIDVTWAKSITTISVYMAILVPLGLTSWAVNSIIEQLFANNRRFQMEIEARKEAEAIAQTQNAWFRKVLDGLPDLFGVFDREGKLVDANRATCENLGYSREELIGMPIADLDVEWTTEGVQYYLDQGLPVGTSAVVTGRNRRKDGSTFPVEAAYSIIEDEGQPRIVGFSRDITERQLAEMALRESEEKFRSIYNSTSIGMYLVDSNRALVDVNDRWLEMIGYSREEVLGRQSTEFLTPASRKQAIEVDFPLFFKQGYVRNLPHQIVRKNGEVFDILLSGTPRHDEEGNFIGILASIVDVTEQRRLQAAVEESEQRFRAVFNNTFSFIGLLDPNGTLLEINETALAFSGLAPEDVLHQPFWETYWWQISAEAQTQLQESIEHAAEGNLVRFEVDTWGADKTVHTIDLTIKPIFDSSGQVILLIPEGRAITELREAERKIAQSEQKFRALFDNSPDFTLVLSPEGEVVDVNNKVDISASRGRDSVIGLPLWDVALQVSPESIQQDMQEMFDEVVTGDVSIRRELEVVLALQGKRFFDAIMTPIRNEAEQLVMVILAARDITELVSTREILRQTATDNEVLLKEVHHRVKNNLQIIVSMLRLESRAIEDPTFQANYQELINRVQSMSLIHQQLLQRDRNIGQIELDSYIKQLVNEIIRTYLVHIKLDIQIDPFQLDIDRAITCGLIVNELVTNAIKYAFPTRTGTLQLIGRRESESVIIEVADNGIGLPPEVDLERATSTGLQLVNMMRRQLSGELTIERGSIHLDTLPQSGPESPQQTVVEQEILDQDALQPDILHPDTLQPDILQTGSGTRFILSFPFEI